MIIYKANGDIRATIEVSEDAEILLQVSDECSFTTKVELSTFVAFAVGDYVEVFGERYHIAKKPTPTKHGTNKYEWTLKFVDARDYLSNVSLYLSDGTALLPYDSDTIYCYDAVCSHDSKIWRYVYPTADKNHTPTEDDYWDEVLAYNVATPYAVGATVHQSNVVYRCIQANTGESLTDDTYWSVMNTAPMWDFATVLSPTDYAQLICDCMNRETTQHWVVGSCIAATPRETTFSNVQCLDAAASVAELFETEMYVDMSGTDYRLNFNRLAYIASPKLELAQGNGLFNISVQENTSSKKVTRLVALGGTKNLNGTYRNGSKRLMLPNAYYLDSALRDAADPHNATVTWDDVYPALTHATDDFSELVAYQIGDQVLYGGLSYDCTTTHTAGAWNAAHFTVSEGQVTSVESIPTASTTKFKFIDTQLTFNPLDPKYIMADGTLPKVHFVTGNMAGYEFPILEFDSVTKQITIQQIQDSTDSVLPTVGYMFDVNDRYYFTDIYMPQSYVTKAELRLKARALDYLSKYEKDQITYSCTVDINAALDLHKGEIVKLVDATFGLDADYRIVSLRRKVRKPYKYDITLSDLPYIPTRITKIENSIKQNETYIERNNLQSVMAKARTFQGAQEAINKAFDPSGDYFTNVIKPLIIETSAVLVGTNEQQYTLTGLEFTAITTNPNYLSWTAGQITDSRVEDTPRTWTIAAGNFTATSGTTAYYCYIRCERALGSTAATIIFDADQHLTKEDPLYYYFLLGTLTSLNDGFRQLWTSKGYTFINGDSIVTGKIQNTQGSVVIDLANETIHFGNIANTAFFNFDAATGVFEYLGVIHQSSTVVDAGGNTSNITVDRGTWSDSAQYYVGNTVQYNGSTYYCEVQPTIGIVPTNIVYWNVIAIAGSDGADAMFLDLTNESSSVTCDSSGNVVGAIQGTTAILYKGATEVEATLYDAVFTGCTGTIVDNAVSVTALSADTATVIVVAIYNGRSYSAVYTITKVYAGADGVDGVDAVIYWLQPSVSVVKKDADGILTPTTVSCTKKKQVGSATPVITTDYTLSYETSDGRSGTYSDAVTVGAATWIEFTYVRDYTILDKERIPVVSDGMTGVNARVVSLTAAALGVAYDTAGANPSPASIVVTATALNTSGSVYYEFFKNDVSVKNATTRTYTYAPRAAYADMPDKIEVQIRENSSTGDVLARDQITIVGQKAGSDAITAILSNEAHTFAASNDGVVSDYFGSGTTIHVYQGTTELVYDGIGTGNGTWKVEAVSDGLTKGSFTDSGTYCTVGDASDFVDEFQRGYVQYTISGKNSAGVAFSLVKTQSFSKSYTGAIGATLYTWIKYADTSIGGGLSDNPTGKEYIGLAYNKTTPTESTTASDYSWSLIKGDTGNTGATGATGADGVTTYTWIKYADVADGTGLYDTPNSSTQYIGIAVNKTTPTESTTKTDYTWSKFKGDQGVAGAQGIAGADGADGAAGADARVVSLTAAALGVVYDTAGANPSPSSIVVTATALNTSGSVYYEFFKNDVSVKNTITRTYTYAPRAAYANMPDKIEVQIRENSSTGAVLARDQITIVGIKAGSDAITAILSNEAHTFAASNSGVVSDYTGSGTTIHVYQGTTELTYDGIGTGNGTWKVEAVSNGLTKGSFTDSGTYCTVGEASGFADELPIGYVQYTISGKNSAGVAFSLVKRQSFSKSYTGAAGAQGKGISSTAITYQLSTSGTTAPTGAWLTSIPSVPAGQYLWTRTIITYTDATTSTSYTVGMMGETGSTGADGTDGTNGVGIASTAVTYQASTDGTAVPTGTWSTSIPSVSASQYLWTRTVWTYTDATTATGYSVGMMGATGAAGADAIYIYCENQNLSVSPSGSAFTKAIVIRLLSGGTPIPIASWTSKTKTLTGLTAAADGSSGNDWTINLTAFTTDIVAVGYVNVSIVYAGVTYALSISVARIFNAVMINGKTWVSGATYIGSCLQRSVVKYGATWYALKTSVGTISSSVPPSESNDWEALNSFSNVATDSLFAEGANVANFIFEDGVMRSQAETDGEPNIILDGVNGTGKIGGYITDADGFKSGTPENWTNSADESDYVQLSPGVVRMQQSDSYEGSAISRSKVGFGEGADPDSTENFTAGYIYRRSSAITASKMYKPALKLISDNVQNRDVAMYIEGAVPIFGGMLPSAYFMDADSVTVLDFSFGNNVIVKNNSYRSVYLPTRVLMGYVMNTTGSFAVEVKIIGAYNNTQNFLLSFQTGESTLYFRNTDGGLRGETISIGAGGVVTIMLIYDGTNYYAQTMYVSA